MNAIQPHRALTAPATQWMLALALVMPLAAAPSGAVGQIFADGFESGDTSGWSLSVP